MNQRKFSSKVMSSSDKELELTQKFKGGITSQGEVRASVTIGETASYIDITSRNPQIVEY